MFLLGFLYLVWIRNSWHEDWMSNLHNPNLYSDWLLKGQIYICYNFTSSNFFQHLIFSCFAVSFITHFSVVNIWEPVHACAVNTFIAILCLDTFSTLRRKIFIFAPKIAFFRTLFYRNSEEYPPPTDFDFYMSEKFKKLVLNHYLVICLFPFPFPLWFVSSH